MPPMVEIARNIGVSKPPFVSAALFGGDYHWANDASIFTLAGASLLPLLALLAGSLYFSIIDVITTFEFIVVVMSFSAMAPWLRGGRAARFTAAE